VDGRIKLYTIHRALMCRRRAHDLFQAGAYVALSAAGERAQHLCAFARRQQVRAVLTVVPRLAAPLTDNGARLPLGGDVWGDTCLRLPQDLPGGPYLNLLTGTEVGAVSSETGTLLRVAEILADFPVALLQDAPSASTADGTGAG
jgi:(1->4)-alpha-D-glucan 1-alpha-D-glucosylmutase